MALKQMLGRVLSDLGFITQIQLEAALQRQKEISENIILPERLQRTKLISQSRFSEKAESFPLLGKILMDMGYVTEDKLKMALKAQENMIERYATLESKALCSVMDVGVVVNSSLHVVEVLGLIMKNACKVTQAVASTLMLVEEGTGDLVFSVPTGPTADILIDIRIPRGQGIAGWVAKHDQPVLVTDVSEDPRFYSVIDRITGLETKSILAVPLKAKAKLIGVLEVINKSDGSFFTEEDTLLLTIFASHAAMAIENARLYGELKEYYEERSKAERKLAETEKLRALGQLSSGIAHDFNNILGIILGYAGIARSDNHNEARVKQSIEQIITAGNRARDLVTQILSYSRQGQLEKLPVEMDHLIRESLKLISPSLPSNIEIRQAIPSGLGTIIGNPTQIQQVVMNLCTNALHAMGDKKGVLEVGLSREDLDPGDEFVHSAGLSPGTFITLCVRDNGCGMEECTMKQIFEPYFTTKEKGLGTGLGLAVLQGIVKSHGGAVRVTSEAGKGSTFEVLFPLFSRSLGDKPGS